ncbi:arylsulfatase [Aquiflexum sp. TKW24L]|uniref:sulfatase family protein n=1 Tax=Aquiflexum sp. TKW24L TaxID=2942212 RepID=UPI0020C12810|nr:arylsulfatase [Aquiflexum sp. TKW24L]MCL6258257.1 arylsulfatase [Aquiflexum sp. TKW24L]
MKSIKKLLAVILLPLSVGCNEKATQTEENSLPNIVIIYMDDLGYGDLSAYGATEIQTPHMDRLANEGMKFTNAYATSATCTPSRYALLTGIYPWRNENAKILAGTAPLLIAVDQMTIPKMLKTKGYHTSIVGKWHLGLGDGNVDWNQRVSPGPNEVGFDYSYIMAATQDRVPTVYIQDGHVVGLEADDPILVDYDKNYEGEPTGIDNPELLKMKWHHGHNSSIVNGIPRIGFMKGGEKAKWVDEDMADHFLIKAQDYIRGKKNDENPFFLYFAMQQPHVPRTPHPRFVGSSGMGPRGDVILEADWAIGELMKTLEEEGLLENTLVIFSSDNGPVLNDGYYDDAVEKLGNHTPWGPFRGGKYSLFEAGTRMPLVTYWKGKIRPGVSDALVSQLDLLSSLSKLVGSDITTEDSKDMLTLLMGESDLGREEVILEATTRTALRSGDYIMIPPYNGPAINTAVNIELGNDSNYQLYNIKVDPGQKNNLATSEPAMLEKLKQRFEELRGVGYSKIEQLELK